MLHFGEQKQKVEHAVDTLRPLGGPEERTAGTDGRRAAQQQWEEFMRTITPKKRLLEVLTLVVPVPGSFISQLSLRPLKVKWL